MIEIDIEKTKEAEKKDIEEMLEAFRNVGRQLGMIAQALSDGFKEGVEEALYIKEETEKDCGKCWCDICKNLEACEVAEEKEENSHRPKPCQGCKAGMRYMPKEKPPCHKYEQVANIENRE